MMIQLKMKKNCPNEKSKSEKVDVEISCRRPNIYSIILVFDGVMPKQLLSKSQKTLKESTKWDLRT